MKFLSTLALALASASFVASAPSPDSSNDDSSLVSKKAGPLGLDNANCQSVTVNAHAVSNNTAFQNVNDKYSNQTYVSQQILQFLQYPDAYKQKHINGSTFTNDKTYKITGKLCQPKKGAAANSSLIVGVHGIGFDSTYWDYSLAPEYSFVKHAASHGYSSFIYDRLGTGGSETPNSGFREAQVYTEVAIYQDIVRQLRAGKIGNKSFKRITGMGHSYGSAQTQSLSKMTPELLDGIVLTGFSTNSDGLAAFVEGGAYTIAQDTTLSQLKSKPRTWLANGVIAGLISQFFSPLENTFSPASLALSFKSAQAVTLGAYFTIGTAAGASNFTGPVVVINGNEDFPFCNSNCSTVVNGTTIPEGVKSLYPTASNFSSVIVPQTGHGISAHYSSSAAYEQVMSFIIANKL